MTRLNQPTSLIWNPLKQVISVLFTRLCFPCLVQMECCFNAIDLPMLKTLRIGCDYLSFSDNTFSDCCSIVFESRYVFKAREQTYHNYNRLFSVETFLKEEENIHFYWMIHNPDNLRTNWSCEVVLLESFLQIDLPLLTKLTGGYNCFHDIDFVFLESIIF